MPTNTRVELQRQLPGNLVISGGYTRREKRNQLGQRNVAVPANTYQPLTVVERNSNQTVTVYNQAAALRGRLDTVWDNDAEMDSTYNGGDITLNKRLSNRWMLTGGLSLGKNVGYVGAADLNNPNSKEYSRGVQGNDVPFSLSMSGLYELPYGISLSGSYQHQSGFPELTTVSVGANTVASDPGDAGGQRGAARGRAVPITESARFQPAQGDPLRQQGVSAAARCL